MIDKKKVTLKGFVLLLTVCLTAGAGAQSVTVNSEGGGDYLSVQAALDAVASNADAPDVITITGGGPHKR